MYQNHFGLAEPPFSIAPDPRYLYMSERHREALAHLLYGVNGEGGFVLLTGEVGTGKTTVCRCLLEQVPAECDIAFIFNPRLTVEELLSTICDEFRIEYPAGNRSVKVFVDRINAHLLAAHAKGRKSVLIIDEAQNLSADVLEQMRLLTNLETNQRKLLQIVLLGQPELLALLDRPELRQVAQRVVARYHLGPLSKQEVAAYVAHRLAVSGARGEPLPASLMGKVYGWSGGIPRLINLLCDRAMLGAYVQGKDRVDRRTLRNAAREAFGARAAPTPVFTRARQAFACALLLAGGAGLAAAYYQWEPQLAAWYSGARGESAPKSGSAPVASPGAGEKPAESAKRDLDWQSRVSLARSEALAFQALYQRWGVEYDADGELTPCARAEGLGLRCLSGRGTLDELQQLNLPAVVRLKGEEKEYHAALIGLHEQSARFVMGSETREVPLSAIAPHWSGNYTVLWRAPREYSGNLHPGSRGPAVTWLVRALAKAQGSDEEAALSSTYDAEMIARVKQFQLSRGLVPDGIVGPQTLIRLVAAYKREGPRLVER